MKPYWHCVLITALALGATAAAPSFASASSFQAVYTFPDGPLGGAPNGPMVEMGGVLYGSTGGGSYYPGCGADPCVFYGTIFRFDPRSNALTTVHAFDATTANSVAGLSADRFGNIYGDTINTLFSLNPATDAVATLFSAPHPELTHPPVIDKSGILYGWRRARDEYGEIVKYDPATRATSQVYKFTAVGGLMANLLLNPSGTILYGSYSQFNTTHHRPVPGVIFQIDLATHVYTALDSFIGGHDGAGPSGQMAINGEGQLFGVTQTGGKSFGQIFKFDPGTGRMTTLYNFSGGADGAYPTAGITLGPAGQIYGTTEAVFFLSHPGTLFQFDLPHLSLTTLHSFTATDGSDFAGPPTLADDGSIYCATQYGGIGRGYLFRYIPDSPATLPARHGGPILPTSVSSDAGR